ncbi:MAG: hypothetical protein AAF488_01375 [Planctomycetota bacterium]
MAHAYSKFLPRFVFGVLAVLATFGCSSLDSVARNDLAKAEAEIATQPWAALTTLDRLIVDHPEDLRILEARSRAFEALEQWSDALESWNTVLDLTDPGDLERQIRAQAGVGRSTLAIAGPVSDEYRLPDVEFADRLLAASRAFTEVATARPGEVTAPLGQATCQYFLGRHGLAKQQVDAVLATHPDHGGAQFLDLRIRQQLVGLSTGWIRELGALVTHEEPEVRATAAQHLVGIAARDDLDPRVRSEVSATLARIRQQPNLPEGLLAQLDTYESEQADRRQSQNARRFLAQARRAKDRGDWRQGWAAIQEARRLDPQLDRELRAYTDGWANALTDSIRRDLDQGRVALAAETRKTLKKLPAGHFSDETRGRVAELESAFDAAWSRYGIAVSLGQAREQVAAGKSLEALETLDGIAKNVPTERRVEFDVLKAEALAAAERFSEAVEILDALAQSGALADYRDTPVYRTYGILLSTVDRSEEAQAILEELPLHLFDSQAFHALILALEKQGRWETALARLQGLSTLPEKYRPIWVHCAAQAAQRRLRSGDGDAAKLLLESYLKEEDFKAPEVKEVYVQVLIDTGEFDAATEIILQADEDLLSYLPSNLLDRVRERAANELPIDRQFDLYVRLLTHKPDDNDLRDQVNELWPEYGDYLPQPGDYTAKYQVRTLVGGSTTRDLESIELELTWKETHFDVKTPQGPEEWRVVDGVWIRTTAGIEMRLPCRATDRPPYPVEQFKQARQLWSAQVVEAGTSVEVRGRKFDNCLRVHVINEANQNHYRYLVLAPNTGIVLREEYRFGELNKVWEFISLEPR